MSAFKLVVNCGTTEDLTIRVDHKSVQMALLLSDNAASPEITKRKRRKKTCGKGWTPVDPHAYAFALDHRLEDCLSVDSLEENARLLRLVSQRSLRNAELMSQTTRTAKQT